MARPKSGLPVPDYSSKKDVDDVPVAPCQGWIDDCEFCQKRLGKWEEANEEVLEKVPTKPGIFALALKNKNVTEVVDIVLDKSDIQKAAYSRIDLVKNKVSDKKSKATKSVILCKWMTFKQSNDKDVVNLCAHWYNNGVLPKMSDAWPGSDVLQKQDILTFSEKLQKWCYPQKDAFWRKPKGPPTKLAEVVDGCVWNEPCDICDSYFGEWRQLDDVVDNELSPDSNGIYMVGVKHGKTIETINICFGHGSIPICIRSGVKQIRTSLSHAIRNKKYLHNSIFLVRWLEVSDEGSDNCCFLYAHWINSDKMPEMNFKMPGEELLDRNKYFVMRNHDKKWCYEIEIFKNLKKTKFKTKRTIMQDLKEDYRNLNCSDDA